MPHSCRRTRTTMICHRWITLVPCRRLDIIIIIIVIIIIIINTVTIVIHWFLAAGWMLEGRVDQVSALSVPHAHVSSCAKVRCTRVLLLLLLLLLLVVVVVVVVVVAAAAAAAAAVAVSLAFLLFLLLLIFLL